MAEIADPSRPAWDTTIMDRFFVNTVPTCMPEIWSPGGTGIHRAILGGRLHQVRLLISMKANVDKRDSAGYTPLMISAMMSNDDHGVRCIKVLLRAGADVKMVDFMGRSALGLACLHGRTKAVEILLQEDRLEKNFADKNGDTPLNLAASQGYTEIVKLVVASLVKDGIPVDKRNNQGCTALLLATKLGHYDCARILLENGKASVSSRDNDCFMNSLEWARYSQEKLMNEIRTRSSAFVDDPRLRAAYPRPESVPPPTTSSSSRTVKRFIPPFHSFAQEIERIGEMRRRQEELTHLILAFQERDKDRSEAGSRCGHRRKDSRASVSRVTSASTYRLDPHNNSDRSTNSTPLALGIIFKLYTEQQRIRPQVTTRSLLARVPSMVEPTSERHGSPVTRPPPVRRHQTSMLSNSSNSNVAKRRTTITTLS